MEQKEKFDTENQADLEKELPLISKKNYSNRLVDHVINGVIVFSSVFLAFWLNDYRQDQVERHGSMELLSSVVKEIQKNEEILERWSPLHKQIIDRTEAFLIDRVDTAQTFNISFLTEGHPIIQELLTTSSWENMNRNNLKLDLNDRILVNRIYRQQTYVENAMTDLTRDFFNQREILDANKTKENYMIFYHLMSELYGQEIAMIREYKIALSRLTVRIED